MTLLSRSMTGNALTRCSRSLVAISLNEANSLTAITWVLITSLTVAFMARGLLWRYAGQMLSAGMTTTGQWA